MSQIRIQSAITSPLQIDKSWNAINVSQAVGDMAFGSCQLIDETTDERWVARQGESSDWPINIPYGHLVGASFLCENSGDVPLDVFVYIALIDPDGITRAFDWNPRGTIPNRLNPGVGYYSNYIGGVQLDKNGLWVIYGRLEYDVA